MAPSREVVRLRNSRSVVYRRCMLVFLCEYKLLQLDYLTLIY